MKVYLHYQRLILPLHMDLKFEHFLWQKPILSILNVLFFINLTVKKSSFSQSVIDLFSGLKRAHGCTYVEKKSSDGTKIKGKSFVKREPVTDKLWQDHLNGIEPSLGIIPIDENNKC